MPLVEAVAGRGFGEDDPEERVEILPGKGAGYTRRLRARVRSSA